MGITDKITDAIKEMLISCIESNLEEMFTDVNEKVGTIAQQVGQTPQGWNSSIFNMIKNLSENVIVPIAGLIITFVLCYELITMVMEKNNMHDFETFMFFKYLFKMWVAVWLLTHVFDITMAVFDLAQYVVNKSALVITGSTAIDVTATITEMMERLEEMSIGGLVALTLESMLISLCMKIMSILITVILYVRMIEIYLYTSVSPIPFATLTNREWGTIGTNYLRGLLTLGFQGFFLMVCVAIYSVLINSMTIEENIHTALFSIAAYTVILCFSLFKTMSISKSIFNAH
ncbi:MAG: VirB6/TrbL-like conjugal transfer protein, CD1112 family [Lachnospiraceae bacterium]